MSMGEKIRETGRRVGPVRGGTLAMLVGAGCLLGGLAQTTSASPRGANCPKDTVLFAKFEWKGKSYVFEKGSGGPGGVTISAGTETGGSWSSTSPIVAIVVKGGPGSVTTTYSPGATAGVFDNKGLPPVGKGNTPDISNVQFCTPDPKVTTTDPKVTTTDPKVTTTDPKETTTTTQATTTTAPATTTTQATSTTAPATTTTAPVTTTTEGSNTTTTRVDGSTTTVNQGSTSTTAATSSTTTVASSSTVASSTTVAPTSTSTTVKVAGASVTSTSISTNDSAVRSGDALAFTGAPSLMLVIIGLMLFVGGGTVVALARLRAAHELD